MPTPASACAPDAIVLYDGDCALCRRTQWFVQRHDPHKRFRFLPLQSPPGQALLAAHRLPEDHLDSVILLEADIVFLRSTAILRICRRLSGPWQLLYAGIILPLALRDWLYDWVARRRPRT